MLTEGNLTIIVFTKIRRCRIIAIDVIVTDKSQPAESAFSRATNKADKALIQEQRSLTKRA